MTINLTYDPSLARVVIELSDFVDGNVLVERSLNNLLWTTVRGGVSLPVQAGSSTLYDYEFAPDVINYYRVTPVEPGPGMVLPGTAGAYADTPDHPILDISGNIDLRADVTAETWTPTVRQNLVAKYTTTGDQRSYRLVLETSGRLRMSWATDGTLAGMISAVSTTEIPAADGERIALRATLDVDNGAGGNTVVFYTSDTISGTWVPLGSPVITATPTHIFSGTAPLEAGSSDSGTSLELFTGTIHALEVRDGIEGNPITQALKLNGTSTTYANAADAASLDIVGDIDLRAFIRMADYSNVSTRYLVSKFFTTGNQRSYALRITDTGLLNIIWSANGTSSIPISSTVALSTVVDGDDDVAVRATLDVDNGAAGNTVTFYTAPSLAGPWTQLGAPVITAGVTSIFVSTSLLTVGGRQGGTAADTAIGRIYGVEVLNGIAGTVVASPDYTATGDGWANGDDSTTPGIADGQGNVWTLLTDAIITDQAVVANPDFAIQTLGTTSFQDDAGRTWTLHGAAAITGTAQTSSITPAFGDEVWLKSIRYSLLNRIVECPDYGQIDRAFRGGIHDVKGRSQPTAVVDLRGSQTFTITVITRTLEQARDMDLILAANQIMFLQVPREVVDGCGDVVSAVPGGYVAILGTAQRRALKGGQIFAWDLPCVVVSKPGPDFVGTTLTWGTVYNLYGSWEALINSNPTWTDLFATVGSPDDLVVL